MSLLEMLSEENTQNNDENTQSQEPQEGQIQENTVEESGQETTQSQDENCESPECQRALIEFIKNEFGEDLSHYKNDLEAIRGLINARKMVGKRDADARVAQLLRQKYGDEFIEQLIAGQIPPVVSQANQQAAQNRVNDDEIEWDDSWLSLVTRNENGELVPVPGAPKDIPEKILRFVRHRESLVNAFAKNPRKFIEEIVGDTILKKVEHVIDSKLQQTVNVAAEQATIQEWAAANRTLLFKDGDPNGELTPLGEELVAKANELMADGISSPVRAIMRAWEMVASRAQAPKKPLPVPPTSMHAAGRNKSAKRVTIEDLIDKGYSLVEAYQMVRDSEQ